MLEARPVCRGRLKHLSLHFFQCHTSFFGPFVNVKMLKYTHSYDQNLYLLHS